MRDEKEERKKQARSNSRVHNNTYIQAEGTYVCMYIHMYMHLVIVENHIL